MNDYSRWHIKHEKQFIHDSFHLWTLCIYIDYIQTNIIPIYWFVSCRYNVYVYKCIHYHLFITICWMLMVYILYGLYRSLLYFVYYVQYRNLVLYYSTDIRKVILNSERCKECIFFFFFFFIVNILYIFVWNKNIERTFYQK